MNPAEEGFGYAPYEWQLSVHNCLVVRVDGEDITPYQVEALSHFTQHHLAEAFEDVMGERMEQFNNEGQKKEKEMVLDLINPKNFASSSWSSGSRIWRRTRTWPGLAIRYTFPRGTLQFHVSAP